MSKNKYDDIGGEYKYGFKTDVKNVFDTGKGLNEDVIRTISKMKNEPEWMLEFRLKSYKAFLELKQQYNIPRIRFINENPFRSIAFSESKEWIKDGALVKSFILSFCAVLNKILYRYKSDTYFYSIIHTCKISAQRIKELKVPPIYKKAEIMLHPGMPEIDKQFKEDIFDDNILNDWRSIELQALLNNKVKKNKK
jgi:hypothetical protein